MNARLRLSAALVAALLATAAQAQPHVRPGLWEETVTTKTDNAQANAAMEQMKQRIAAMTPEQRAAMEKMMGGHAMPMSGAPNVMRVCITKEQAERSFTPEGNGGHCSRSNVSTSGSITKFDYACESTHSTVTGHGVFTAMGDTGFSVISSSDMVGTKTTMHIDSQIAGKFISSNCGDVKPVELPPQK